MIMEGEDRAQDEEENEEEEEEKADEPITSSEQDSLPHVNGGVERSRRTSACA